MPRPKPPVQREELATILKIVCASLELLDSFQEKWLQARTFRAEMPKEVSDLAKDTPRHAGVSFDDLKEALLNWRYSRRWLRWKRLASAGAEASPNESAVEPGAGAGKVAASSATPEPVDTSATAAS